MAKNAFNYCPNISLPENKKRIKEIGIDAFYKEYFDTNFSVDLQESNRNIIDYLFVDIDTFSFSMQNEIIDSILYYVDQELNDGTTNVSEVFNNIREAFEGELESFKEVNDDNSLDTYIDIFENVLSHWDSFKDFSIRRLDDLGLKLEKGKQDKPKLINIENLAEVQEGGLEDPSLVATESDYRRDNYDDSFQFSKSTRDNASGRLKYALARLESEEDNFLGLPKYESLDKVWNKVLTTFAPVLENEIVEKLEALSETDPLFTSLLQKLQADPSGTMINEFVTTFSNQQAGFFTVLLNPTNKGVSSKVFESNRNNAYNVLVADWASNMLNTSLVEEVDGNYKINTEEGARLNQLLEILASPGREISVDQYKSALDNFLKGFGIELSDTTLDSLLTQGVPQGDSFIDIESFANENLRVLVDRVSGKLNNIEADPSVPVDEGESTIDDDFNNPFITETSTIVLLAMAELSKNPFIYESSWITGEGTSRYTYVKNSHLSKTFKLIESESAQRDKFFNNLKKAAFSEHSFWANELNNPSSSFSDNFKLSYLDTIRKENSAYDSGVQFKNMGDIDKALTRIFLFTNQGRSDNGVGVFIPLIPSDKTTIPTIQANKIKVGRNAEGELNIATRKALYNVFISEYNRIKEVQRQEGKFEDKYKLRPEDQIDGYHHGMGNKFVILDFLNDNELLFEKESGRIKDIDNIDIRDIGDLLEDFINHKIDQQKEAWEELGLDIPKVLDTTYKENLQAETDNEILDKFTDDYIINNFISSVNYMQVFYGDPAFLGKSSIDQTWVNIFKRGAKDIAPGSDGNHTSSSYRTLMVSDTEVESRHIKEYTEALTKITDISTNTDKTVYLDISTAPEGNSVDYVFEENPELANSVYEALGFKQGHTNFYEGNIKPEPNTIFVFGSNPEGRHGAGAAKVARTQFGAKYGQGEGLQGSAYALPTKDLRVKENRGFKSISPEQITGSIKKLYEIARQNPNKQFKVAYRNTTETSLNGYTGLEMIDMFNKAGNIPFNIIFSKEWIDTGKLNKQSQITPEQKQQAQQLYSQYLEQGGSQGDIQEFKNFVSKSFEDSSTTKSVDTEVETKHIKEYTEALTKVTDSGEVSSKIGPYTRMEIADAQEYTTLQEHLAILKAYGKATPEVIQAVENLQKGSTDAMDLVHGLKPLFDIQLGPQKPVQVGFVFDDVSNTNRMFYIKTSSFPLIPGLTKGLEIDKLRQFMENRTDENGNPDPIDRMVYKTGVKEGFPRKAQKAFLSDGSFNTELEDNSIVLDRSIFRIQQEVPHEPSESMTNEASQAKKLLYVDADNNSEILFKGEKKAAKELKDRFDTLHTEKMSRAMDQLLEDTGIEKSSKGDLIVKDISKLQEVLVQEAIERNFNINDLYGLQLIKDPQTGVSKFTIPLTYHDNSAKIESLINSLFTNRVIKQELPGFSAVQGSKIGFERLVTQEDLSGENIDLNQSDVIWIDPKDTTLNYIRANEQGTELLAADILVPQFIKTNSGSYINIKNYIKEDGSLDTNKINPEVLELFGFRIPTQGYNSMMRFKVKGFLPPYVGPLAIVPAEVVAQMGSDFDVDKLFFYRKHYTHDPKTRSINPIEYDYNKPISEYSVQELDNAIVDLYLERLKDPELLEKILEPNSFGQLENLSKEINYLKGENKTRSSYDNNQLFPLDQDKVHKANNDGKIGVGIFSLYSVFNRFAQDSELSLNHITVNGRSNLGYTGAEGESSNMIIQYFQSAAVDNANEQILGNLNINNSNMNVVGLLGLLGIDESTISYFTSHPTMVEYSRRLENIDNILSEDFISNTSQSVIIEMLQEMGHDYMKALEIYDNSVNSVMDIKLDKQVLKEQLTSEDTLNEDILTSFIALNTTARHVSKLMGVVGLDTRGLSSSYAELSSISQNILDIASLKEEYAPVDGGQRLLNSPYISSLVNTVLSTWDLYASLFDYGAPFYRDSVHNIRNLVGKINSPLSASHIKKINNFIKSHVINSSGIIHADNVVEQRAELAFDFEDNKSLGTRLEEYFATPKGQKSLLKEHIQIRPHKKHIGLKLIQSINNPGALVADRNSVIAEVYNMFYKGDSTERQLAQDLAKYYILTGGQYNTSSIGRLIPLDILTDEHDYDGKLRDFSRRIQHLDVDPGDGTSYIDYMSVVNQYFQTYPSEAFPFTLGSDDSNAYTKDTSENTVFMNNQNARSLIEVENIEGDIVQDFPRFISRRLEKAGFELYILQNTEEQSTTNPTTQEIEVFQEAKYTRIPTLDLRNFMQNTPNRRLANTLLTKDRVKGFSPSEVKSNSTKKVESPISKPNFNDNTNASMEQLNNWKSQFDLSAPDSIIRTLLEDPSLDSQYKSMLRDILPLISQNNIVFDEAKNHPIAKEILDTVFGVAEGSTVYLNLDKIGIQYNPNDVLAENLIHETLHALTIGKLIADPETLTPNELAHRKRIEALYDTYLKEYAPEQQIERFREIHYKLTSPDKAEREQVPYADRNFYMKKELELYPLLNIKEFVAAGLTSKNFREKLEKNNFWQELWAAISDLLGLNIKYENDYAALFDSALGLSNRNDAINFNVSPNTTPLNMSYNERQNKNQLLAQKARETFVNQRQEFLDKYNTEIGKRISEETLERFRNSIKDNPKYNMLSIDSWYGELRVSRKTTQSRPDFNIGGLEEESKLAEIKEILDKPKTPEQRAIEKTVARLVNIRNKFRSSGKAKDNPVIAQKIETISKEIKALKESQSVMKILDDAVTKLDEIERKLKNNELSDVLDLEEATRYLGFYKDLENIVQFDVAFDEENSRVRAIASKAANLIEELKLAKLDTVSSYLNNELSIEFDAKEILTTPLIDVTHREQLTQSGQMSSSKAIQLMAALIEKKQIETQMEYNNYIDSMGSIIEAYAKQYRGNYNMFLQKDKNGNNTGYLLNEYSHEYYQELIKRKKNPKEFAKFKRENTKIEITKEDNKRWKEDLEEVKKINPLWEQEGTIDYENFNDFLYTNSPVLYLKRYNAGQDLTGLGRARRYLTETPIEEWRDPSYADLMNLPDSDPAKILYDVLHSEFKAMARKYGNQSNFIPEFNAKYLDSFLKGDIRGGFDKLSEVFKDSFYKTVHPNVKESEVDLDGKPFDTIPVMHMQDTLNPADKDYNLGRVLLLAKQQELANRHKLDIEPYLVMMKELISDLPAHTVNRQSGEIMLDEDNKPKLNTAPDRHFKTMGQINYMMDDYLYGKGSKSSGAVKDWTRSIVTVNSKGETIETTKVFTGSAVGDSINVFTRAKGIFLNPMTGVANGLWGILSNMMLAAERRYFNESTFLRAIGFVISANNLASTRNKKFRNLFDKFHVMKRRSEMNFGKLGVSTTGKPGESFTGFFFDEYAERFIQGTTMVGILMTKKVKALDGTMHSIFDAHDKEGNWNTEKFGEDPFSNVNKRLKIVTEVSTAVGDAHGDYDRSIKIKEGILGRMIMVFRTWIPQSVSKRFGREYEDIYGEVRKGRYRSLLNKDYLTIVPLIKDMYQAYKTDAEQDTVDTRNLRAIGVEMAASAFILTIGMIIRGMLGDMDDEDKEAYYFVLNSMTRLHGDLTFYFNPNSFSSTIREPIPAFKTMMDFIALRKSATDFITGDDEFTTGHRAGRSKFWYNFRKQFPVLNQPEKIENLMKNYFER